ncbi:MAG: MATE family efflux transporter [Clostridiales bacterium]|nr:MATE family efflux transporter [Clostridiales bacterium]
MNEKNVPVQDNKMGVLPVNQLLLSMALPLIISMLVQAAYNIVDSVFVSMVSEDALTAVSLAFPIQTVMIAVANGTGVGVNSILSKALGEKKHGEATQMANHGIFLAFCSFLVFVLVGAFVSGPFYHSQVSADSEIAIGGIQYMTICCCFSFGLFMQNMLERLLQSTGHTVQTMISQSTGAIINIILDPLLIFGVGIFPEMGVAGAAIATVIGQHIAACIAFYMNIRYNTEISLSLRKVFQPKLDIIKRIYVVGVPTIIMQSIGSVTTYGMNLILVSFTTTATTVYGVYYKLQSIFFMPVFGLTSAMVPIIAFNYGAQKRSRLVQTIRLGVCYALGFMALGIVLFQAFPAQLLSIFSASESMLEIGVPALRTLSLSYIFAGVCIVLGTTFQALGNGVYSMLVSFGRQIVVLLPVAYFLSKVGGLSTIWWAFPIAELVSMGLSLYFFLRIYRKVIRNVPDVA